MDNYENNKVKEYTYWTLYLYENQGYLGRCYVWCKREDALDLPHATKEEQEELFIILKEIESILVNRFGADLINYAFLGNVDHHLHGHIIPRYSKDIVFEGITFKDERFGKNYMTDTTFVTPPHVLEKIKDVFLSKE